VKKSNLIPSEENLKKDLKDSLDSVIGEVSELVTKLSESIDITFKDDEEIDMTKKKMNEILSEIEISLDSVKKVASIKTISENNILEEE
jgi:hypothetical protein